jgi:hypothetical protein
MKSYSEGQYALQNGALPNHLQPPSEGCGWKVVTSATALALMPINPDTIAAATGADTNPPSRFFLRSIDFSPISTSFFPQTKCDPKINNSNTKVDEGKDGRQDITYAQYVNGNAHKSESSSGRMAMRMRVVRRP